MYATFAGLQWRDGALSFARRRARCRSCGTGAARRVVEELTMTQLPIAMFEDTAVHRDAARRARPATCS